MSTLCVSVFACVLDVSACIYYWEEKASWLGVACVITQHRVCHTLMGEKRSKDQEVKRKREGRHGKGIWVNADERGMGACWLHKTTEER